MRRPFLSRRALIEALAAAAPASALALLGLRAAAAAPPVVRRCPTNECGYLYDPAIGDPEAGIPPGVAFEDLPERWKCPVCARLKARW